jgi:Asp-tRNA(Asn)/Glu-tRNA(Gln) amidotransferase B subunit
MAGITSPQFVIFGVKEQEVKRSIMIVRAKFNVSSITRTTGGHTITLSPVTSGSKENESFYKYTPGGSIVLSTINDSAVEAFGNPGDSFYVDFTKAE